MLKLTMTCGPYDRVRPLVDKRVQPEGIELEVDLNPRNPGSHGSRDARARPRIAFRLMLFEALLFKGCCRCVRV